MEDNFARIFNLTSHISNQFIRFIEDNFFTNVNGCSEDLVINSFGEGSGSVSRSSCNSVFEGISSSSIHYETARIPGIHGRRSSNVTELPVISTIGTLINDNCRYIRFFFQGLTFTSYGLQIIRKIAFASWSCVVRYARCAKVRVRRYINVSILSRVQMTLRGSSDDIGWLQTSPGMAPVVDGTARFLELLQRVRNGEHMLPDLFVYLLIPGLFSNHGPLYFVSTKRFFSNMGLACHIAKIHSEASVEHNAWELKQYIDELYWGSGKRVMLLGHSKGGVDAAAALSIYWSDLRDKVAGLALVQSPYGGTPIASDILRKGQLADKETRRVMEFLICKLIKGDLRSVEDLTYEKRREFILKHKLPEQIPLVSFHSEAHIGLGVLATLTQVGHVELPWLPLLTCARGASKEDGSSIWSACRVPVVMPISAAMAICALLLLLRYGEQSDGLVTCRDAEVPGSVVIRPDRKLDHGRMVHSSWKKNPDEPDACEMCEAILTLLVELGKAKH
ncbi:hypothetical protein Nepgr_025664 [Nepenthes gracilis]|uniref:Alpha/beta-Hydrolases superfamily protein n=1 Tax=Nepenthes gracilis TaxID=150966 RepID=A0AAD3Y1R7_NEPGR|nr:hypothetical protein Nepgr_025664 [Nepenthes gracilis]